MRLVVNRRFAQNGKRRRNVGQGLLDRSTALSVASRALEQGSVQLDSSGLKSLPPSSMPFLGSQIDSFEE